MSEPDPLPPPNHVPPRPIHRIALETLVVALAGATVLGIAWEIGHDDIGWIAAVIIWIAGGPALEILRLMSMRKR